MQQNTRKSFVSSKAQTTCHPLTHQHIKFLSSNTFPFPLQVLEHDRWFYPVSGTSAGEAKRVGLHSKCPCLLWYCMRSVQDREEKESVSISVSLSLPVSVSLLAPLPLQAYFCPSSCCSEVSTSTCPRVHCPQHRGKSSQGDSWLLRCLAVQLVARLNSECLVIETESVLPHGERQTIVIFFYYENTSLCQENYSNAEGFLKLQFLPSSGLSFPYCASLSHCSVSSLRMRLPIPFPGLIVVTKKVMLRIF